MADSFYTSRAHAAVSAVITRADGTVHDLGVISFQHPSRWLRLHWRLFGHRQAQKRIAAANNHPTVKGQP